MSVEIVAEIGAAHAQDLSIAKRLVKAAADAGADCVKFQTWDEMTVCNDVIQTGPWAGKTLVDLYTETRLPWEWHAELFQYARDLGIEPFSTPFDKRSVDFLETLGCTRYKIASFEITDLELIAYAASTGKPMIISTGMAKRHEIERVVSSIGNEITLLVCVSAYPAPPADFNLETIPAMRQAFGRRVGLSDHSEGSAVACAAIALDATMVEKHIQTFDANHDSGFATSTACFSRFVKDCRDASAAMGQAVHGPRKSEEDQLQFRRSIWVTKDVEKGEPLTTENVAVLRPQGGLEPAWFRRVLECQADRALKRGKPLYYQDMVPRQ